LSRQRQKKILAASKNRDALLELENLHRKTARRRKEKYLCDGIPDSEVPACGARVHHHRVPELCDIIPSANVQGQFSGVYA